MAAIVEGPLIAALSCGKPVYLVVLLHGHDSDGQTLINHALNWAPTMPKAEFLAAEPGLARDGVPSGRQWFDMADTSPAKMIKGVKTVAPLLDNFLDEMLAKRRLPEFSSCARRLFARRDARTTCGAPAPKANGGDRGVFGRSV